MRLRMWLRVAFSILIVTHTAAPAWSHAEIFSECSLEQAKQQAQQGSKLLLIDFTASWCPPCKMMESSTWTDDSVKSWIKDNAIAIQVDVDKDRETMSALNVNAMPTLVLFTPGSGAKEFGRQVGYMSATDLLQWLNGAKSGKSAAVLEKEQASSGGEDVWSHISTAREKSTSGNYADALEEYVWLWNNVPMDNPNFGNLRTAMVPFEVKKLFVAYPAAKARFAQIRDEAEKSGNRRDWLILNAVLDDNSRSLAWFDKAKIDPKQGEVIRKNISELEPVLFSKCRWTDAASYLYPEPVAKINEYYKNAQDMKKPRPDTEIAKDFDPFPSMITLIYGAYIGAGREVEAKKIADECLRLDDTPTMRTALANMADGMRKARASQTKTTK